MLASRHTRRLKPLSFSSCIVEKERKCCSQAVKALQQQVRFKSSSKLSKDSIRSLSAGLPDWIEHWSRDRFRQLGYGLGAATALSVPLLSSVPISGALAATTAGYWYIGLRDIAQPHQTIRRNFPVLGNARYLLEMIRPEIRQYFIEGDNEATPFARDQRNVVYRRAKGIQSVMPFGTRRNVDDVGYEWINHSLYPSTLDDARVIIGGNNAETTQPYSSSLLNISAMSYGALSGKAILSLSSGAKLGGFSHNSGEGGISKFHKDGGADIVWNIGTAYFGCGKFDENHARIFDPDLFAENSKHAKMIEIKLSQGAKPAHGGMLPKEKITELIADARDLPYPATVDCNSPPGHSAFSNAEEMCHFIAKLRKLSGGKPIGFKLCVGLPEEFSELVHAFIKTGIHPDFITVDGGEGGTGAAPNEFSNHVGYPLAEGLSFVHAILVGTGYRDPVDKSKSKIALICSGKVLSGFSMYKNFALGADVCNAARSFLFSLGCIQALKCDTNTCPTGITTQDPALAWGLDPASKTVRVANFHKETVHVVLELMQATGVKSWGEIGPHHVCKRTGLGESKTLNEIHDHLNVKPGELLKNTGPKRLLEAWDLHDNIVVKAI
mmetsp:Transcript_46759/g.69156  ORF Transcript_46759/g.69156 Transcript_46759/m.69156 type:complete len:609 (-) Transcript_46759:99-1925(-)|eukprot:CAMPEP_0195524554 /NCGR_PEP_ID=MMETSP0794_2-20130614/24460_1 /TAXON_ID=515487 /ORGANISM="Stephanopyxis turris, Strain CCMP 815" /LENGTH=608 /DNA_ID=CAMNT_0040654803 /DNA_START=31 /DNA_END=1857 /DNA_ORIENTATION=+